MNFSREEKSWNVSWLDRKFQSCVCLLRNRASEVNSSDLMNSRFERRSKWRSEKNKVTTSGRAPRELSVHIITWRISKASSIKSQLENRSEPIKVQIKGEARLPVSIFGSFSAALMTSMHTLSAWSRENLSPNDKQGLPLADAYHRAQVPLRTEGHARTPENPFPHDRTLFLPVYLAARIRVNFHRRVFRMFGLNMSTPERKEGETAFSSYRFRLLLSPLAVDGVVCVFFFESDNNKWGNDERMSYFITRMGWERTGLINYSREVSITEGKDKRRETAPRGRKRCKIS